MIIECGSEINNKRIDHPKRLDILVLMYNLIETAIII